MPELRAVAVLVLTVLVLTGTGCRHPVLVADAGPKPAEPGGTISGQLQTPGGGAPVVGRLVTAVNNANGQRFEVRTGNTGGFTLKVPPGSYRREVELQSGEGVTGAPPISASGRATWMRISSSPSDRSRAPASMRAGTEVPAPHHLVVLVFGYMGIPRPPDLRVVW